jgi:hypothetical protein
LIGAGAGLQCRCRRCTNLNERDSPPG